MGVILGFARLVGIVLAVLGAMGFYMHFTLLASPQYTLLFQALVLGTSIFCFAAGLAFIFLMRLILVAVPMLLMFIVGRMGGGVAGGFTPRGGPFN